MVDRMEDAMKREMEMGMDSEDRANIARISPMNVRLKGKERLANRTMNRMNR
jgi:hypothetical protein